MSPLPVCWCSFVRRRGARSLRESNTPRPSWQRRAPSRFTNSVPSASVRTCSASPLRALIRNSVKQTRPRTVRAIPRRTRSGEAPGNQKSLGVCCRRPRSNGCVGPSDVTAGRLVGSPHLRLKRILWLVACACVAHVVLKTRSPLQPSQTYAGSKLVIRPPPAAACCGAFLRGRDLAVILCSSSATLVLQSFCAGQKFWIDRRRANRGTDWTHGFTDSARNAALAFSIRCRRSATWMAKGNAKPQSE